MTDEDRAFLERFENAAIPADQWTHRDHVRMALLYLRENPIEIALGRIRTGIKALNAANSVRNGLKSGYHETITVAWARLVLAAMRIDNAPASAGEFLEVHPELLQKDRLGLYYSRDRIMSWLAKESFVEPDLVALPAPSSID